MWCLFDLRMSFHALNQPVAVMEATHRLRHVLYTIWTKSIDPSFASPSVVFVFISG